MSADELYAQYLALPKRTLTDEEYAQAHLDFIEFAIAQGPVPHGWLVAYGDWLLELYMIQQGL